MKILRTLFVGLAVFWVIFWAAGVDAQERILNYDVTIEVQKNADLIVTENITVNSEGRNIRRGIFRDLPRYKLDEGDTIPYQYKILSVKKNGVKEPFDNSAQDNAKRLRIGDAEIYLENGEYIYEIRYRVKNEIRYGDSTDELYWNVTGNYWNFPIEKARATILLPDGTAAGAIKDINGYAGALGAKDVATRVRSRFSPIVIDVPSQLSRGQGLTVSVVFDKGVVDLPSQADKTLLWWFKNGALLLLSFSFVGMFGFYYFAWNKVGKDPQKLPVYPRYTPPDGYSAAAVHKLTTRLGGDNEGLIATLMSLAVKGAISLESKKNETKIVNLGLSNTSTALLEDEAYLLEKLFSDGQSRMTLSKTYNKSFTRAYTAFGSWVSHKYSKDYFRWNLGYTMLGIIFSVFAIGASISQVYGDWKLGFIALFIGLLVVNIAFLFLMPAPTKKGQVVTAEIEGFKLYLKTAESKRFAKQVSENVAEAPPTMTQDLYERYLPYAVALDVEKPWSKYFENILPEAAKAYNPSWGHIHNSRGGASGFTKSLSSNLSSGVSSSLPKSSGSSGGGGGGSSGGGGGGGGGGGW